ncbi:MAG: peptidyl-prolyl cis-trans isomerase [Chlamydiae bacterium]|nr:peptidyl-prolyl cis-trans isomerase [Chlamydiota bacterium]MBI3267215.1 peptidyl-prolyl cis-trans isomerase [Chlamydiota bacterium]
MLKKIRKNTKLILWTLLTLIVPPFLFFGIESVFARKEDGVVGILFGQKIRLSDFLKERNNASAILSLKQSSLRDPSFLEQVAWQRMILLHEAQKSGVGVTDQELSREIVKAFAKDPKDVFDSRIYEFYVKNALKLSVYEFEKAYRETLLIEKFQEALKKLVQVSDDEIYESYYYEKEKLDIRYCEIASNRFLDSVSVNELELKQYFDQHPENFRVGVQRRVNYFAVNVKDLADQKMVVSSKEVETFYQKHKENFKKPLTEVSQEIENQLKKGKASKLAQKISRKIYHGLSKKKSFVKVAQECGFPVQRTDFFTRGNPLPIWKNEAGLLKNIFEGDLKESLEPVWVNEVYYVVVPMREKPSYIPSLEEVQTQVRDLLIGEKAKEEAKKKAEEIYGKLLSAKNDPKFSFSQSCKALGEKVEKLSPFTRPESLVSSDAYGMIRKAAWDVEIGKISQVVETQNGSAFFWVKKSLDPSREEFEKLKTAYHDRVLARKQQKIFYEYYQWLLKQCEIFELKK